MNKLEKITVGAAIILAALGINKLHNVKNTNIQHENARKTSIVQYDSVGTYTISQDFDTLNKEDQDLMIGNDLYRITLNNRPEYATVEEYNALRNKLSGKQNNDFNPGDTVKYPIYFEERQESR